MIRIWNFWIFLGENFKLLDLWKKAPLILFHFLYTEHSFHPSLFFPSYFCNSLKTLFLKLN